MQRLKKFSTYSLKSNAVQSRCQILESAVLSYEYYELCI